MVIDWLDRQAKQKVHWVRISWIWIQIIILGNARLPKAMIILFLISSSFMQNQIELI